MQIFRKIDFEFGWSESFVTRLVFTWAPLEAWSSGLQLRWTCGWNIHSLIECVLVDYEWIWNAPTKRQLCFRNSCQMDVNVSTNLFVNTFDGLKNEFFVASLFMLRSRENSYNKSELEAISGVPNWSLHKCTTKRLCKHFGKMCKFVDVDFSNVWLGSFPRDLRKHPTFWLSSASSRVLLSRQSRLPLGGNTFDVITIRQKRTLDIHNWVLLYILAYIHILSIVCLDPILLIFDACIGHRDGSISINWDKHLKWIFRWRLFAR